ncbi:MAG: transglycosylase [Alphaproteobacteria bacterium CG_4_9_14_3_um_filter_47_13]|nr:MAG: transglycosylase [Alphaproteobacteria bacterium CG_4_9_14_3_um_filter_47_13]
MIPFLKNMNRGVNVTAIGALCKKSSLLTGSILWFWMALCFPVCAQTEESVMSSGDRAVTLQALAEIKKGHWTKAETMIAGTRDPLAAKIYYWLAYTKNADDVSFGRITSFSMQNPDWPGQRRMRLNAEQALTKKIGDDEILAWFGKNRPLTQDAMERYLDALERHNFITELRETAQDWWKNALIAPDQQSRFLSKYGKYLDEKSHRFRMDMLISKGHYTNARMIARLMGHGYPALAEARIAIASDNEGLNALIAGVPPHLAHDPGLVYERLRWRRRHNQDFGALEILHNPPPADTIINLPDWWNERHIMARRLMEQGQYESAYLLVSKHQQKEGLPFAQAEFLAGWLALRLKKPWRAFEHFEALYLKVSMPVSKARGAYWAGRASDNLGHPEISRKWYQAAARHQTTYYGQLALEKLDGVDRPPQQMPPQRSLESRNSFNRSEMAQITRILNKAGYRKEAGDFLDAMAEKIRIPEDYIFVADLAKELNHYHNAVRIAKKGLEKNILMLDQAFPTLLTSMKKIDLEWSLVHAIIRQESAFDYDAQSPAGARGLMQLMPATAKEVAGKKGLSYNIDWLTSRPDYNIALGSSYMEQMLRRFNGSYALAAAAYNGGPGRVDKWLKQFGDPRKDEIDIVDWVELIPVYETRNYVQRVLENTYVYRMKFQDLQKIDLPPIHASSSALKP